MDSTEYASRSYLGLWGLGHATYSSDLDIAILCDHTMSSDLKSTLISTLARATGRPVDLVDLTQAGEPFLGEILKNGTRILSRDDSAYAELLRKHLFDSTDLLLSESNSGGETKEMDRKLIDEKLESLQHLC